MLKFSPVILAAIFLLQLLCAGCQSGARVCLAGTDGHREYYFVNTHGSSFSVATTNILGNYLLNERIENSDPEHLISDMENIFRTDPRYEVQAAIAETALYLAEKNSDEKSYVPLLLSALLHSDACLKKFAAQEVAVISPERNRIFMISNQALTALFIWLKQRGIALNGAFTLKAAGGQTICFASPHIDLPLKNSDIKEFLPCANFRTLQLTHNARSFGAGVPLIALVSSENRRSEAALEALNNIPATLLFKVADEADVLQDRRITARLDFVDPMRYDFVALRGQQIYLEQDFSTPLAYAASETPAQNYILRTLFPESTRYEGLYLLNPRDERIPVLFVHGLMSDIRTWIQMINTLQSDPQIRKNFRFMGFSYSSGNPVLFSAHLLRKALEAERKRMIECGLPLHNFDRMVVVGHSMGGLLTRVLVSSSGDDELNKLMNKAAFDKLKAQLDEDEMASIREKVVFKPFPSVQRAVFIAAPHRGSVMAVSWYGQLGAKLIRLPGRIVKQNQRIIAALLGIGEKKYAEELEQFNGVFNLVPGGMALKLINLLRLPVIPYHSIIGNEKDTAPGGSDGVVAYASSHLDGAASETVIKSGHSVQQNPLAIQEIRRILLVHLKNYPELGAVSRNNPLLQPPLNMEQK